MRGPAGAPGPGRGLRGRVVDFLARSVQSGGGPGSFPGDASHGRAKITAAGPGRRVFSSLQRRSLRCRTLHGNDSASHGPASFIEGTFAGGGARFTRPYFFADP